MSTVFYETTGGTWVPRVIMWCPGPGHPWQAVYPKPVRFSWEPDPWWERR